MSTTAIVNLSAVNPTALQAAIDAAAAGKTIVQVLQLNKGTYLIIMN